MFAKLIIDIRNKSKNNIRMRDLETCENIHRLVIKFTKHNQDL